MIQEKYTWQNRVREIFIKDDFNYYNQVVYDYNLHVNILCKEAVAFFMEISHIRPSSRVSEFQKMHVVLSCSWKVGCCLVIKGLKSNCSC